MGQDQTDRAGEKGPGQGERLLRDRARALETIDEVGRVLAAELDLGTLVQAITDAGTRLTEAQFGAFFYNVVNEKGETYSLYTISGVPREAFSKFPMPRNTAVFDPTFKGQGIVRSDDITKDPRYGQSGAHYGMPNGHLPVRSYLAAPVVSRTGEVIGGLFFGHAEASVFSTEHEGLLVGIARYAAIAVDNARLYERSRSGELANARLAAIVQSSDDAIVSKDLTGMVQSWNPGAERMFGYTAEEMVGRPITVLFPQDRVDEEAGILERLRRGERVDHFETIRRTKDGRDINVSVSISPVRDATGNIVGASKVARDITDRKRTEVERERLLAAEREARAEAERHSRMKDEFLATLGHELRTPLNAVMGWASVLKDRKTVNTPEELAHGLAVIERNAKLQGQLIEDLLDMSRIISGNLRLNVQLVELPGVIRAAMESVRPAAEAKGLRLHEVLDPLAGVVSGDPGRLQQVIWNLLSNAVKFTPKGGRVQVVLERVNSHVEVTVADTGEGIAPEFLPLVFDRFRQADASTTRQHGGLGLGLAIVKHLVELHGGNVRAKSPGKNQGASFTVVLPVRATRGNHADERGGDREGWNGRAASSRPEREREGAPLCEVSLRGVHAVVVDDEPDARELVGRVLMDAGATVELAASAEEGLAAIRRSTPDVLVSDIGMPGEDGYSLLRRVRELPESGGGCVPAVALTAFARADDRRRALLSGFQMHVPKPVEPSELVAVIASVTRRV
jgi:PAS domain S-box-containing protein